MWIAVEPSLRRLWPELLISWNRLLDGRLRDPMVGRDVLVGTLSGVVIWLLQIYAARSTGWIPDSSWNLAGVRFGLAGLLGSAYLSVIFPLLFTTVLLILRMLLRRRWLASLAWVVIVASTAPFLGSGLSIVTVVAVAVASSRAPQTEGRPRAVPAAC